VMLMAFGSSKISPALLPHYQPNNPCLPQLALPQLTSS